MSKSKLYPKGTENCISSKLKGTKEQHDVVGPLVEFLVSRKGWDEKQIIYGKNEWRVPKTPSEQTKREKQQSFAGFPVDIAIFDSPENRGDPRHIIVLIECKQPTEEAGVSQLESYFVGEPHAKLGIWINNPNPSAQAAFIYRRSDGSMLLKRRSVNDLPSPGDQIKPDAQQISLKDLIPPTEGIFRKIVEDLLDKVVVSDSIVTRREDQLAARG